MTYELTVTKVHEWDMAHRLGDGYTSKCKHLHGHRYKLEITLGCAKLDPYGMVQDFGTIKTLLGGWIDQHLDHAALVSLNDGRLLDFVKEEGQRHHAVKFNTTVEHIVVWLAGVLQQVLDEHVRNKAALAPKAEPNFVLRDSGRALTITHLRLYETPNGYADWYKPE